MEEFLARKYQWIDRNTFFFTVLVYVVSYSVKTVWNTRVKTMVKRLLFYGRTAEQNLELYFVSYCTVLLHNLF